MKFEDAKKYVDELNVNVFAGFTDWRLPTLEETMSLIEQEQKHGNLYIDPIFEKKQTWIWTSNMVGRTAWAWVDFFSGRCFIFRFICYGPVRAVRFGQSS